jgi:outer membrane porin, OprD family
MSRHGVAIFASAAALALAVNAVFADDTLPVPASDAASNAESSAADVDYEPNQQSNIESPVEEEAAKKGFWESSTLKFKPRSYYLDRFRDNRPDITGWSLGGAIEFKSGWLLDRIKFAGAFWTSQKAYGPSDKDGTQLFKPGPESINVFSEAYATVRIVDDLELRVGRQSFELPYLGSHDIRMIPNTFEAITLVRPSTEGLAYIAGYVDAIKQKNDNQFVSMSEAAGVRDGNQGVVFAGAQYIFKNDTLIGAINQHTFDVFNTVFAKVERAFLINEDLVLKAFIQYTDQRSVGIAKIGEFNTSLISGKLELTFGNATFRVGGSSTGSRKGIQKPYGNPANYLSIIVNDFDRADEDAWMVGANYNFRRVGPGDLSGFANIAVGNTPDVGLNASPDQTEYNLTADYKLKEGWSDNLWFRVRAAYIDQDERVAGGNDFFDFRVIVNYSLDVL